MGLIDLTTLRLGEECETMILENFLSLKANRPSAKLGAKVYLYTKMSCLSIAQYPSHDLLKKRKGQRRTPANYHTTSAHLVCWQWSWIMMQLHGNQRTTVPPATTWAPGIMGGSLELLVFVLNVKMMLPWEACKAAADIQDWFVSGDTIRQYPEVNTQNPVPCIGVSQLIA